MSGFTAEALRGLCVLRASAVKSLGSHLLSQGAAVIIIDSPLVLCSNQIDKTTEVPGQKLKVEFSFRWET